MNETILELVYAAIDEVNDDRSDLPALEKSLDMPIHGTESSLDSLGLINFLVAVEERVEQEFGAVIVLSDDRALAVEPSPFASVRALTTYIETLLGERQEQGEDGALHR